MEESKLLTLDTQTFNHLTSTESSCLGRKFTPLVTIAIPTLRRPHYLREALRSVVEQTYRNLQIIVSDNGSGDSTPDVVSEFKDHRILFRQNPITIPALAHYHQCLSCAGGYYFMMLSDDDKISPTYVEGMVEVMGTWPEATAAFGSSCLIDPQGAVQQSCMLDKAWCEPGPGFLRDWFLRRRRLPTFSVVSVFTRTCLVKKYGGPPDLHNFADVAFVLTLALTGPVAFSDKGCFYYRVHAGGDCVTMSWANRVKSVRGFNQYLAGEPIRTLTKAITRRELRALCYATDHGLAYTCLSQLYHLGIPQMTVFEIVKALLMYPFNIAYLLCLPRLAYWTLRRRRLLVPYWKAPHVTRKTGTS